MRHDERHIMKRLTGTVRTYSWGSYDAIPDILGKEADGKPWAEYWLGAHETSPSTLDGIPPVSYTHLTLPTILLV